MKNVSKKELLLLFLAAIIGWAAIIIPVINGQDEKLYLVNWLPWALFTLIPITILLTKIFSKK